MAKRELKWTPLLGQFSERWAFLCCLSMLHLSRLICLAVSLSGAVFVDRKNNKDAVKLMNQAGDDMKRKGVSSENKGFVLFRSPCLRSTDFIMGFPRGYSFLTTRASFTSLQEGGVPFGCTRYVFVTSCC